ncbi:MAG: translocation/assembly module TamB domain-containing protein [Hyphomonadaceae bacterium]
MSRKRTLRRVGIGAGVAALGALAWSIGPGAPGLVSWLADGREIWRLGRLDLEGVSGPHIAALRAARFTLSDEQGVWIEARGIDLSWSPLALLFNDVDVAAVSAEELDVARRPILSAPRPPGWFQPDVNIASIRARTINFAEPVAGVAAQITLTGVMTMEDRDLSLLSLEARRLDADTDRLTLRINARENELLFAEARGAAGGLLAHMLGVEDRSVALDARGIGVAREGEGTIVATIGEDSLAGGRMHWGVEDWGATLAINPSFAPIFSQITGRFGPALTLEARGERNDRARQPFTLTARADNLELTANGHFNRVWRADGPVRLSATIPDLNRIAPELFLDADAAALAGDLTLRDGRIDFAGDARANNVGEGVVRADAAGAVTFAWTARAADATANLSLTPRGAPETRRLLANGRLNLRIVYDRGDERIVVRRGDLQSEALRIEAQGAVDDAQGALNGRWQISRLAAASPEIAGAARGAWRMRRQGEEPWRIEADGLARDVRARAAPLDQLLGATPRMEFTGTLIEGGVRVDRAVLNGARLRAGAQGLFRETLDLRVEATARGPIRAGNAEITGAIDATGAVTGPLAHPRLTMEASMSRFDLAGAAIERPQLRFSYDFAARQGEGDVQGLFAGSPAHAEAQISATNDALVLSDLNAQALGLTGTGQAAFTNDGPSLTLAVAGPLTAMNAELSGAVEANVTLTPTLGQPPRLDLRAGVTQAAFGDLRFSHALLALEGPIDNLAARLALRGASGDTAVDFNATGSIVSASERTIATLEARGALGGETLATRTPARIEIANGRLNAEGSFIAGDGRADLSWQSEGERFAASARFDRAELAPFAALAGQRAEGTASGDLRVASANGGLAGQANLSINGARLPARMRSPLDIRIDARLEPTRVTGSLIANSNDGFEGAVEGSAPVETSANPVRIALADGGEGEAAWRARGPADSLWSLVGGLDQSLGGNVEGQGRIRFNAAALRGAGNLALTNGRFEDRAAGFQFHDVDARIEFTEAGASRFTIAATGPEGGRLTGSGSASGLRQGELDLSMRALRFVDREDISAMATGDITLAWTPEGARLSGALALDQAELTLVTRADAIIPEMEVIEINRPGGDLPPPRPRAPGPSAALDLRLTAPSRIYTRGRGLNAEWSLDARLQGRSNAPLIYGEARLVRGEFALAGRPFDIERGTIQLRGALEAATLDLLAERTEPELTARVAISGDLFDPTITFSSDPALPEDEILPHILFGRAQEDLSPLEGAQLAASLASIAGGSAFDIAGMARAAIGLDRFDVREDEEGIVVSGGRYLTRDVYLEFSRSGIGEAGTRIEWRVRPQLSLVTSFLGSEDQRASVRWRRDY